MKKLMVLLPVLALVAMGTLRDQPTGAWVRQEGDITHTLVIIDDYYSLSSFDISGKKFIHTEGGTCTMESGLMTGTVEYNTSARQKVGSTFKTAWSIKKGKLTVDLGGQQAGWQRSDDGSGPLAGNWRITGRDQGGKMVEIKPAARKTIKLLSGKRFQWAAINMATGEFFGTGGGTYTFENGKYTEYIEFFSRDSSRVGMSLSFDGKVDGRNWHHSGKSSKGDPISEVWSR
jgi:hypothetical protein